MNEKNAINEAVEAHFSLQRWLSWHVKNNSFLVQLFRQNIHLRYANPLIAAVSLMWPYFLYGVFFIGVSSVYNTSEHDEFWRKGIAYLPVWVFFSAALVQANSAAQSGSFLMRNAPVPYTYIVMAGIGVALFEFIIALSFVFAIGIFAGTPVDWIEFFVAHTSVVLFSVAYALLAALIVGLFPPLSSIVLMASQLLVVLTPLFATGRIPNATLAVFPLNTGMLASANWLRVIGAYQSATTLTTLAFSVALLGLAFIVHYRFAHRIADR